MINGINCEASFSIRQETSFLRSWTASISVTLTEENLSRIGGLFADEIMVAVDNEINFGHGYIVEYSVDTPLKNISVKVSGSGKLFAIKPV